VDATSFELNVSVPRDTRYADTLRDLAIHAARYAGCRGADADRFGEVVAGVVLACLRESRGEDVPVIVRRSDGPVEFLIAAERRFEAAATRDAHITIGWTHENGQSMCRVARSMPRDNS
jgi:hypothetical protein